MEKRAWRAPLVARDAHRARARFLEKRYYHSTREHEYPPEIKAVLKGGDSDWFQQFGFKNVGGGAELSIERKLTFGHGIPTWSPYFNAPRDEAWVSTRKGTLRNTSTLHPIGGY